MVGVATLHFPCKCVLSMVCTAIQCICGLEIKLELEVNLKMSSSKESADADQQSYFYVVWPEESKSPSVCTSFSATSSTAPCCSNASILSSGADEAPIAANTALSLSVSQPAPSYDVVGSRHSSSSSCSVQSRSPDESPLHMQQQALSMASLQNKLPAHGLLDNPPKISSNGIRAPHHLAASLSSAGGGITTSTTYVLPSISSAPARHTKTVVLPTDISPVRIAYSREPESGDANLRDIGNLARQAITKLQKIVVASGSGSGQSSRRLETTYGVDHSLAEDPPPAKRPCALNSTSQGNCLECEVKNAEINILRRRMQQLQEDLEMAHSSNESKTHSSPSFEEKHSHTKTGLRQIPETIFISDSQHHMSTTPQQQLHQQHQQQQQQIQHQPFQQQQQQIQLSQQQIPQHQPRPLISTPKATTIIQTEARQQSQSASTSGKPSIDYVELVPGSDVYISSLKLEEATRDAKTGTQLARKLMDAFWDKDTLARSTLTPRSKFQYQQLDPKVIKSIEAYCLSHDSTLHSKDIHATMTDKCCQARSRYRTVTTSQVLYNPE